MEQQNLHRVRHAADQQAPAQQLYPNTAAFPSYPTQPIPQQPPQTHGVPIGMQQGQFYSAPPQQPPQPQPGQGSYGYSQNAFGAQFLDQMSNYAPLAPYLMGTVGQNLNLDENIQKYVSMNSFKYYFNVNTAYVTKKIQLLLLPYKQSFSRKIISRDEVGGPENLPPLHPPPRDDVNAPDLYIPLMAFVTWILLYAFLLGTEHKFNPEILGVRATTGFFVLFLEVLTIKLGSYLLSPSNVPLLDVIAYSGYSFVYIVINMLVGAVFGKFAYYPLLLVTGTSLATFMLHTLKRLIPAQGSTPTRQYFILILAASQYLIAYFMGMVL